MTNNSKTLLYKTITDLTEISASSLDKLFEIANKRQLTKGETILKEGQICKNIMFVEKGYVRTFIDKDGTEINTDFTFEGNFTTNLKSLRSASSADNSIQAGEITTLYEFDKDKLLELYNVSAEIESFGRKLLEQLLIAQEEHTNLFKIYSPTERYQYLQTSKPEILQRISLSQLSSYLGIARETLSRIRKK
ncbi:MAG: Crp/Fnr family transcriptional regulator [Daejeonella sp.]|uniref:Crp/Fnr family transcriptional regulator n=1 Tax=Daejeonella sp. TaxID=2805397 RepID=UPI0027346F5A|nr:Crp/Fnr family transcriptional regulator [Daejeonella sp.]MDP3469844.1 Crp/Fnr family transcriptional regulator [Daejeonella sp.]